MKCLFHRKAAPVSKVAGEGANAKSGDELASTSKKVEEAYMYDGKSGGLEIMGDPALEGYN